MKYYLFISVTLLFFSCFGKTEQLAKSFTFLKSNAIHLSKDKISKVDNCPNLDSVIYNNKWVRLLEGHSFSNFANLHDSIFVLNNMDIDFNEFLRLTKSKKIKDITSVLKQNYYDKSSFTLVPIYIHET